MRSNVRKMWTALLAVLFAAAVGFGLWFAFAPADRPASVQAVEDGKASLEIGLDANGGTLYSNQDVNRLIGDFFIEGTVHYADGGTDDLLEFQTDGSVSFQVYADYSEGNFGEPCDDLRPNEEKQEGRDGNTYQRWIVASIELDGTPVSSKPLLVNVTRATPSDINVDLSNNVFAALNTIPPENITVEIEYEPGADYTYTVPYGEYTIFYGAGPEYHDRLEFGDSEIKISYREYEGQTPLTETKRVRVTEALVVAPTWASYAGTDSPVLPYTGEEQTLSLVGYDQDAMTLSEESGFDTTITDETPEFTMTDAGEYSVTISVNEGYKFRSDIPTYAEPTYDPSDPEKITALTYNWSISPAEIIEVSVAWKWAGGWYYSQEGVEKPKDSDIEEVTIKYGNEEQVTKSPDEVGAKAITFYFSGTANDGTTITDSTDLPTQAGNYTWRVELTGMKNFNDFTGSSGNGGVGSFTIQKKSLTVPSLEKDELPYNGSARSATAASTSTLYSFFSDSGTNVTTEGYEATFTLTDPDNYKWADGAAVSGNKGEIATVTWHIVQAENKATVSLEDWTYGTTAKSPSLTADFGASMVTYSYSGQTNAGVTYNGTSAPTQAGSYTVTATIAETTNYKGATATDTFEVLRAPIAQPELSQSEFTYDGTEKTPTLNVSSQYYTFTVEGKTDAGDGYKATVTLDDNHCWENATGDAATAALELDWKILPAGIGVEGNLSIEGWTYGGYDESANSPSEMSIAQAAQTIADLGGDMLTGEYLYYASNDSSAQPLKGIPSAAGIYYVRYHVYSDTKNFTEAYSGFATFTIAQKEVTVSWSNTEFTYDGTTQTPTATTDDFLNGDDIELKVTGGAKDAGDYTATAELSGTDKDNYVLKEGATESFSIARLTVEIVWGETAFTYDGESHAPTATVGNKVGEDDVSITVSGAQTNAGTSYTATASLAGTDAGNYSLPADATIEFVIHKLEVRIQALGQTGRQLEHTGSPLSPSITLIGPDDVQLEGVATQQGFYDSAQSELGSEPSAYGSYYVLWKLNDSTNYAWGAINESDQISGFKDKINGELIYIAYQITGSSYKITISANNWTVGDTLQDLFSVAAADGYQDKYEAALNEGLTVTYTFLNAAGQQQIGEAIIFTVNAANQNFALTAASIPEGVALNAGTYTLRVEFSESANKNYASAWASATFTVSPYELQKGDVEWTVPENRVYKGAGYTFGAEDTCDIYATYKTWSYANGVYSATENGGYLTLALTGEAGKILNAGDYTLTAELPQGETNVVWGDNASKTHTVTIEKRVVDVTLKEYTVTYNGEAFEPFEAKEGTDYTAAEASVDTVTGLISGDDLQITLTPSSDTDAGSYAWSKITWSNTNYSVNVMNGGEEMFVIDKAPITVKINDQSSVYGENIVSLTVEASKNTETALYTVTGDLYDNADTIFSLSTEQENIFDAGSYKIVGTDSGLQNSGNYDVTFVDAEVSGKNYGTYTITERALTVTVTGTIEYGEEAPTEVLGYAVTLNGALERDEATLKGLLSITAENYSAGDDKGSYTLTVSGNAEQGATWGNYDVTFATSTLNVTQREITVTIQDVTTTYGTMGELKVNVTKSDNLDPIFIDDLVSSVTDTSDPARYAKVFKPVLKNNVGEIVNLAATLDNGTYSIVLAEGSNTNYNITVTEGTYTVGRYQLGITLSQNLHGDETSPVYDGAAWTYSAKANYTVAGLSGEIDFTNQIVYYERTLTSFAETETPLDGAPVDAGSYWAVLPATAASGNFEPTSQVSTDFTIAQRKVDVEWLVDDVEASGYSLGYNGDTGYSITAQYYGWMDGEQNSEPTSLTVTVPSDFRNVKDYDFTAAFATDAEKGNYKFGDQDDKDSVTQTFSIAQAEITVAIKPQTSIYGEKTVDLTVGASKEKETALYTVTGNLYDNANSIFSLSTTATNTSDAQSYQITGTAIGLQNSGNYKVTFVDADDSGVSYGTYTVDRRPVQIALDDFSMIYGTDISAGENHGKLVGLSGLSFKLGTGTTGSPFLAKDSDAEAAAKSAMNFAFAGTSGTYGAQSAANTTWTVTASLSDQASDDLKNYTFEADDNASCTMKVIPRPITVTLPQIGSTSYTYGTAALRDAFSTFKASVSIDDKWADYGEPIVFNDNAEGGVYTLVVKNADDDEITLSASTPVGTYTLAGKAGANSNYSVTFTSEQTFKVTAAQFEVNAQDPVSVSVGYTGKNYYFREDAEAKENPADTYLFNYGLNVTTADFVLSRDIAYTWDFKVGDNSLTCLTDAGEYTVNYTVTAENFETVTGSFTVEISQAGNSWTAGMTTTDGGAYKQASWTYGDPNVYSSLEWTDTFTGYTPSTQFVAAFGEVQIEYYKTRTEGSGSYTYSDKINDPGTFFGFETAVGTYYVKVYVPETNNYKGLTAHGTIEVGKRALDIDWAANNITVDGVTHEGTNTTIGFDNTLMTVDTESLPQGLTIEGKPNESGFTGEITVNVKAEGTTQFYLYFELMDPDNYCWEESATVSGDKDKRIQINFTTNALQNNVTFKFKGQDDDPSQNTGISITFGTELRYKFAASSGDTIGDEHLLIFADSTLANETQNYYISFARTTQGDEEPKNDTYSISSLKGADAGYYWLRVQVYPTSDSSYGYGIGYLKICVTQQEITQDVIDGVDFGSGDELHFTYDGQPHQPSTEGVPSYLHVEFSNSVTNVCDGRVTVTATFTIVDENYKFADGVSPTREITVVIDPYEITHIVWSDREYTYNGTDQKEDVYAYFVDVFGVEHRLRVTADGDFKNVTADGTTFTAVLELYEAQEDFCIQNYKFVVGLAERTHVYTMAKATVEIGIGDAEAVYTGEPIEIDQTQYALRTAISLRDPEILKFLSMIRLIAVDAEGNPAVNVGEYQIILEENEWAYTNIEIVFNDSYAGQLTVSPAVLEVPVLDETQFVYNGSVQKPNVTGKDGVYTIENVGGTDVGDYYVTLTLETDNYRWETTGEKFVKLKYEIVQAEYSFSFDVSDMVYNGAPVSVNAPELPAGEDEASVTYYYTGTTNAGVEYSNSDAPTEAGTYTVTVTISGMHNYKDAKKSVDFVIDRDEIKVSLTFKPQVDGGNGWVYGTVLDDDDIYDLVDGSNPGQGGVTATYSTGSWSGSAIPTEVGEYTLTVTVAETANYKSGSAKVKFEIVQASEDELSFTVSIEGWTYGEEPHAPSVIWGGGLTGHPDQISPVYTYAIAKADGETYSDKDFSATVPTNAGSYVVKATFAETDHYGELSAMCKFVIGKAAASIDTSGVKTNFTYNGRAQAVGGAVLNHSETTLVYSPDTVTAVGSYTVTISAAASTNYTAATATVTVTVSRASAGFSVRIDDWTYGETPSRYTISGGSGGSVTVTYSGTTNAGVKYSSSKVPTEAGEYTITVVMSASGNFLGGTARDSFTIHRAKAEAELTLAGWMYGEEPNAYVLTPEFLREEVIRAVYSDGTYYSEAVPQDVGSYTLTVTYGETDNYLGGEVSCKFSITRYDLGLSVSIEGWTYGDEPNKPVVTGADIVGLTLSYTGTANDGTTWSSNTAPEKAGSYTLTVTVTKAGSYTGESASVAFTIARRLLTLPAWNEEGVRELTEVYGGERMMRSILGFDMALMNVQSETAQFMFNGSGATSVTANIHGVYTIVVSLKDAANYGWADLNEGETLTGPVTLTWTLTERVISLLWLIILLVVLIVIALIVLIVLLKKGGKPDGTDTGKGDVRLSSVAPVGLLLVVAPLGEIIAVVVLGVVLAAVVIADIAVGVRNAKRAKAAENAQEPVPAYGDEAAAEGEAYLGTEVPADDGAEDVPDEGEAYPGTEVPADDGAGVASDEDGMPE